MALSAVGTSLRIVQETGSDGVARKLFRSVRSWNRRDVRKAVRSATQLDLGGPEADRMMLFDGPEQAPATILFAHGAGAQMDNASMTAAAQALAAAGLRVVRFEFDYMARRRTEGGRKPPPRAETLVPEYQAAVAALAVDRPLIIGGKSMGGRVASLVADELHAAGVIAGLLCLGYPFHPSGKPKQLRTAHLQELETPALICQGTRDALGAREEVERYPLPNRIEILWLEDGDHNLKPRKRVTGLTAADHLETVAQAVAAWAGRIVR